MRTATAPSLSDVLAAARETLAHAGIDDPSREALRLWADLANEPQGAALLRRDVAVSAAQVARFREAVARRAGGEPLAYVSGRAGFRLLELRADRRALIPRPETEGLVELALARVRTGTAADIGTGTGCIALSMRQEGAFDRVLGVDLSPDALALARENAVATGLMVTWLHGDLTAPVGDASVDLLVSNPPYLTEAEWAGLDDGVKAWEPAMALHSGADGLVATRRLLDDGCRVMRAGGWIALEIDVARAAEVAALAHGAGWRNVAVERDLFGRERYLLAQRSERS
jgi:release factor glutamine methyltransferase